MQLLTVNMTEITRFTCKLFFPKNAAPHARPYNVSGAVKANIGHLEATSGLAGVIKSILVLEKGLIPPIADLTKLNPSIDSEYLNLKVCKKSKVDT